jgi:hypothetical protein
VEEDAPLTNPEASLPDWITRRVLEFYGGWVKASTVGANETERSAIKTLKSPVKSHKKQEKANIFIILDVGTCWCTPLC